MEIFAISGLINGIFAITFGIIVIFKNWRERINQLFFLMTIALVIWGLSYWQWLLSKDKETALFWIRMLSAGSIFIPLFYFHWVLILLDLNKQKKILIKLLYFISILFLIFSFSDLFIKGAQQKLYFPFWPEPGILYNFYLVIIYLGIVFYSLFLLFKAHNYSPPEKKDQIFYVIIGAILGFGGGITNFFLWYNVPIPPYGNFLGALFPFFLGYATIKFHLFNLKVIATELLTYAIWVFIFVRTIIAESSQEILTNSILLFFLIIFGILLIRGVRKEVEQREKLEILNIKLQELDKVRSEFLSFASHQVKAPMTVVKGFASMIYDGSLGQVSEKIQEAAQKIQISAERLIALVNNLLDLRRIEEGKMEFNFDKIEINDLVSGLVEEFKMLAKNKGLELILKPPTEKIFINADLQKFRQVIQNLIDNSIKYTEKGWVKVEIKKEDEKNVLISVSDSGRGIPKELFPNLFKQFSRDYELAKELQGTGLGLYIAKQIIDGHQGQIWAESPGQNQGNVFYVRMPLT